MHSCSTAAYGTTLLRVALGTVFLAHGFAKLLVMSPSDMTDLCASLGVSAWLVFPVIAFEIFAGIMLVFGVHSRWIAAIATVHLLVASSVHWKNGWSFSNAHGGWEYPVFLALVAAAIAFLGDGALAITRARSTLSGVTAGDAARGP